MIGALAERGVVGTVHRSLAGELGVELADVIGRLLPREERLVNHRAGTDRTAAYEETN